MALKSHCVFHRGMGPIIAAAIHNGHQTRKSVEKRLAIDETTQLREEDPVTGEWAQIAKTQIVGLRSRFEVDLNRPRAESVYEKPEDAWGLQIWDSPPTDEMVDASLKQYDQFYLEVKELLEEMLQEYPHLVIYDLHTYNHRRDGADGPEADPRANPEVNIGTGTMDREFWAPVVDRFVGELRNFDFEGRQLDVRENVKFQGGHFGSWVHENFPGKVCAIAIEFKKFFMDEWKGDADPDEVECIYHSLQATLPGVREALEQM